MQQIARVIEGSSGVGCGVGEEVQEEDVRTAQKGGSAIFTNK